MFQEPFIYTADFLPLTQSTTGDAFQDVALKIAGDSHFQMIRQIHVADNNALNMRIVNASDGYEVIRSKGDARAVSSTAFNGITANGFTPYNFPRPYMVPADSEIVVSAADKSNTVGGNKFRLAIHGNKIYGGEAPYAKRLKREVYSFMLDSGSIAAYDEQTKVFILDSNAGFLVNKLTGSSTGAGLIFFSDVRPWSSGDVHFYNMVGNSQFGNLLTSKRWIPEKVKLTMKCKNLTGVANRFKVTFWGERVYMN